MSLEPMRPASSGVPPVEEPLDIVATPEFQRGVAVASCSPAGPLEKNKKTFYYISPTPEDWTPERVDSFFREYNDSMLQEITIHEAMPGHYLQLAHANRFRAPTLVRGVVFSGTVPAGLTLSTAGVLSGTASTVGTFNFTVQATSSGGSTGSRAYSVVIGQAAVIGDRRKFLSALIVLDVDVAPAWAKQHGVEFASFADLASDPTVRAELERNVAEANEQFSRTEGIKKFTVLPDEWQPDSEELTPTMKLKRRGIHAKYEAEIESMYSE